jgi:PAS domain S-box-containing protein
MNGEAERLLEIRSEAAVGTSLKSLIAEWDDHGPPHPRTEIVAGKGGRKFLLIRKRFSADDLTKEFVYLLVDVTALDIHKPIPINDYRIDSLIESSHDGIILTDMEKPIKVNNSFVRISGLRKEDIEGKAIAEFADSPHVCLKSLNEVFFLVRKQKKSITIMRKMNQGNEIYITGTPTLYKGKVTQVTVNIRDITELQRLREQVTRLTALYLSKAEENQTIHLLGGDIIVESPAMRLLVDLVVRVAHVDSVVLIQGESGTGKEVLARLIHNLSPRSKGPFISINCGAIPENLLESELFGYDKGAFSGAWKDGKAGMFELSHGGTILLDEIGEIPLNLQVKLLKVLQDREVYRLGGVRPTQFDSRVIAVTNRKLGDLVREAKFREDLFYRLNVVPIEVPPLRERREDIFPIAWHYLGAYNHKYKQSKTFSPELIRVLEAYDWPGNVRELQNIVERLVVTSSSEVLTPDQVPPSIHREDKIPWRAPDGPGERSSLPRVVEEVEKELLFQAMQTKKTTREIARLLGVNHSTIVRKIQKYGLRQGEGGGRSKDSGL